MIKLTIGNSYCKIDGLNKKQYSELRSLLSYRVPNMGVINYNDPRSIRFLLSKHCEFPTGLLYLIRGYLVKTNTPTEVKDLRIAPESAIGRFKGVFEVTPYPEQEAAAEAARRFKRGIITMPTGTGKSLVAALIIQKLQVNTLIVVPSLEIKSQMTKMLMSIFGKNKVGPGKGITVSNVDSLDEDTPLVGYDCVIIDEFHHSGAATYRSLNKKAWNDVYYKFGLTATPFRSQDHERLLLEGVLSKVIYRLNYKDAVDRGYIVPMEAYYYQLPKQPVEGFTWGQVYKELVVQNTARNEIIARLLGALLESNISALCLVKEIAHGEELSSFPFANGQDEGSKDLIAAFNSGKTPVLVGTVGILSEGVDTKPCEYVILAGLGKAKNSLMQAFGRGFRKYPGKVSCKVILFNDLSHKWTRAHFREQVKILKEEYDVVPVKIS